MFRNYDVTWMAAWLLGCVLSPPGDCNGQQIWHPQVYINIIFFLQLTAGLSSNFFKHLIYQLDGLPISLFLLTIDFSIKT